MKSTLLILGTLVAYSFAGSCPDGWKMHVMIIFHILLLIMRVMKMVSELVKMKLVVLKFISLSFLGTRW